MKDEDDFHLMVNTFFLLLAISDIRMQLHKITDSAIVKLYYKKFL